MIFTSCGSHAADFSHQEIELITNGSGIMRLFTVDSSDDLPVLRNISTPLAKETITTSEFQTLRERLLATVQDPADSGVGIAAPQVGINKRVIIVQRFDKEAEPFEIYVNPEITAHAGQLINGQEGCLSVPEQSGIVPRWHQITIRYNDAQTFEPREENISGFTAIIFQHETDHLDGIIYTDHIKTKDNE